MLNGRARQLDIRNDMSRKVEFLFAKAGFQSFDDRGCIGSGDAQLNFMALADESQRLPVDRLEFGEQDPAPLDAGAVEQRAQKRSGGGATWPVSSLHRLQIGQHPFDGGRPRFAAIAQVEHESRISHRVSAKSGRGDVARPKIFLDVSK